MAERDFATKLQNVGFVDLAVVDRRPFGVRDAEAYPLFTPDLIGMMRRLLPPERHHRIADTITLIAHRPAADQDPRGSSSSGG